MGLLNLDQETAFGSGEASSVLAAGGEQEKQPRICRNHDQDQDQVRLTSIKRACNVPAASAVAPVHHVSSDRTQVISYAYIVPPGLLRIQ